jgi:hypothetical protein
MRLGGWRVERSGRALEGPWVWGKGFGGLWEGLCGRRLGGCCRSSWFQEGSGRTSGRGLVRSWRERGGLAGV